MSRSVVKGVTVTKKPSSPTKKALANLANKKIGKVVVEEKDVVSSNLKSVKYSKVTKVLTILFNTDRTYKYLEVPERIYLNLLKATSKGLYFNAYIKYRYKYKEI